MALVTVEELVEYMSQINLTDNQKIAAQQVLDGVQQQLESYLNRPLSPVRVREAGMSDWSGVVRASVTPIHSVISVEAMHGTAVEQEPTITPVPPEDAERIYDAISTTKIESTVVPGGIYVGGTGAWYVIEYVGGYKGYVDDGIKLDIMRVAAREMTENHDDVLSIKTDFAAEPNAPVIVKGWQDDELRKWDRQRRRVIC